MPKDDLLYYYNQELAFIRQLGAEFAEAHPKIASRLRLGAKSVEDPHVARLIEAFALLNAKTRCKLEDDLPEYRDALLDILYPHYQAPIPSMSIMQLQPTAGKLMGKKVIAKNTQIISDANYGEQCQFSTCYPVTLWPISVGQAKLTGLPIQAPAIDGIKQAKASLRLNLTANNNLTFTEIAPDCLRFFINAPLQHAYALYELLFQHTIAMSVTYSPYDSEPLAIDRSCLKAVGFQANEGMLPYEPRTFLGYRMLTEFFTLPEKFLFFDIEGLNSVAKEKLMADRQTLEIYFYLDQTNLELEHNLNAKYFALGCTPVVNLFKHTADPIMLDHTKSEYHLIVDSHKPIQATEVYSIEKVTAINQVGVERNYQPFYGLTHYEAEGETAFWYAKRRPGWYANRYVQQGSESFLSFVDPYFELNSTENWSIRVDLLCTNRDLAGKLPFGGDEPQLSLLASDEHVTKIKCLTPITASQRPTFTDNKGWQLISHLSLNHLSLADNKQGLAALKEILKLYDFTNTDENRNLREGLVGLSCRRKTARNTTPHGNVFWQGLEIILEVDEQLFHSTSLFLFASVLDHFFGLYSTINSFTQLVITTKHGGELYRWQPRAGAHPLI